MAVVAFACFILDTTVIDGIFNRVFEPWELLPWSALALLLASLGSWRLRSVRRMTVDRHELAVVKGLRPRVFSYADIEAVSLTVVGGKIVWQRDR